MEEQPTIAIIGASGYVGKFLTTEFLEFGLKSGKLAELRVLSTKVKASEDIQSFVDKVSALGTGAGTKESKSAILDALTSAGVKIYFPSEFGTNHYTRCINYKHEVFEGKKEHFQNSQNKGIKTIAILCSLIMESSFGKWFGLDTMSEVWTLVGKGDTIVAVSAEKDIGRFTLEAALMAYRDPKNTPDYIEVFSDMKTMKQYAKIFDEKAGRPTKLEFTPMEQALAHYESTQHKFEYLLQILFEEGAFDYSTAKGNELLNPGERVWKLKTIEEYAQETGGRPWQDFESENSLTLSK